MKHLLRNTLISLTLVSLLPCAYSADSADSVNSVNSVNSSDHPGNWMGDLKIPDGPTLKMGVEFFTRADGSRWASFSSPDQDTYDLPVKSIVNSGDAILLDAYFVNLKLTWSVDHFKTEFKQGDFTQSLDLYKVPTFPIKQRPQTPKPPFSYKDDMLAIHSSDGVVLSATLSLPTNPVSHNVVILVPGSGPSNRNEDAAGHQPFAVLADYLARHGIAVIRYDKRGIGHSSGDYEQHTTAQLIDDLTAIAQTIRLQKRFNHIGLIGHSEGAGIAAAVAANRPDLVDFVVSLGGIGLQGLDMMLLQDRTWATDHGATALETDQAMIYVRHYYETLIAQTEVEPRVAALTALYEGQSPENQALIKKLELNAGSLSIDMAKEPSLRTLLLSNPPQDWRLVKCPVLVLNGSLDHQVPPKENIAGIVAALHAGGNRSVKAIELPSLNHLFQTAITGKEDEYSTIEETIAPIALQTITRFSNEH